MTTPEQDDRTDTDELVERTDNGLRGTDPDEQPSQDPGDVPAGTVSEVLG